jgi:ABC-type proline/glycine betaine transport system permease subunit
MSSQLTTLRALTLALLNTDQGIPSDAYFALLTHIESVGGAVAASDLDLLVHATDGFYYIPEGVEIKWLS